MQLMLYHFVLWSRFLSHFAMSILESPLCYGEMKRGSFQLCVSISSTSFLLGNKGVWNVLQLCLNGTKWVVR
jgi:hypothetical protein